MNNIAIYGAGGFGREVACIINKINEKNPTWNIIGFFDDGKVKGQRNEYGEILGGIDELNNYPHELNIVIAIGNGNVIKNVHEKIVNKNINFPNIIYDLWLADENNIEIGQGNIIGKGCTFTCAIKIGDFNVFNGSVVLGHDVHVGAYNVFMPAVRISGEVSIGDCNFFGVSAIVLQQVKIGNNIKLGAGSVLMRKPKDGNLYIGNPAQIFKF